MTVQQAQSVKAQGLVEQAAVGSPDAWESLVAAYGGLVYSVARSTVRSSGDAADVTQTTWLRLVEHIDTLSSPDRVSAWLATTARREGCRVASLERRVIPVEDTTFIELSPQHDDGVDADLLRTETTQSLQHAIAELPERWQTLMRLLMIEPALPYATISEILDMPIGSIGPTRARCLRQLRDLLAAQRQQL